MSFTALQEAIREKKTPVALGLKPTLDAISPKTIQNFEEMFGPGAMANAEALRFQGTQAIASAGALPAVVIHAESYLCYGMMGGDVLWNLISAAKNRGMYVILDIGTANPALWWSCGADAVTVDAYCGSDVCDAPEGKAVIAAVRTANTSADEVQKLMAGDRPLYLAVAEKMARHGAGLLLGCDYSLDVQEIRRRCDKAFLILTNCNAENAAPAFDEMGHGALTVDYTLQSESDVTCAVKAMKEWVSVL